MIESKTVKNSPFLQHFPYNGHERMQQQRIRTRISIINRAPRPTVSPIISARLSSGSLAAMYISMLCKYCDKTSLNIMTRINTCHYTDITHNHKATQTVSGLQNAVKANCLHIPSNKEIRMIKHRFKSSCTVNNFLLRRRCIR